MYEFRLICLIQKIYYAHEPSTETSECNFPLCRHENKFHVWRLLNQVLHLLRHLLILLMGALICRCDLFILLVAEVIQKPVSNIDPLEYSLEISDVIKQAVVEHLHY